MTRLFRHFIAALLIAAIGACAAIGADAPQSLHEKAAAAQITVTAARSTALRLLEAGKISAADAKNVQAAADAGNTAIDMALALGKSDPAAASAKLASAVAIVQAVQTYLATKGATQ